MTELRGVGEERQRPRNIKFKDDAMLLRLREIDHRNWSEIGRIVGLDRTSVVERYKRIKRRQAPISNHVSDSNNQVDTGETIDLLLMNLTAIFDLIENNITILKETPFSETMTREQKKEHLDRQKLLTTQIQSAQKLATTLPEAIQRVRGACTIEDLKRILIRVMEKVGPREHELIIAEMRAIHRQNQGS